MSDDQTRKILAIRGANRAKVDKLLAEVKAIRAQERTELAAVLTESQKTRLKELAIEKLPKTSDDKKPAASKPK